MAAATNYALTHIRHGKSDGEVVEFDVGDKVTGLSDDELESLRASNSIGEKPVDPEKAAKTIADLEAELAETRAKLNEALSAKAPPGNPGVPTMTPPAS